MRRPLQDLGGPRVNTPGGAPVSTFAVTDPSVQADKAPVGPRLLDFSGLASSIAAAGQRRQDFEGEEFERIGKEAAALHEKHPDWSNEQVIAEVSKSTNSPHSVIRKLNKMFEDGDVDHPRFRMGLEGRRAQYALRSHLNAYTGENRAEWARRYAAAGPGKQGDVHREILAEIQESVNTEIGDQGYWGNSAISEALFEADMKILDMVEKDGRALMREESDLIQGSEFHTLATQVSEEMFDIDPDSMKTVLDDEAAVRLNAALGQKYNAFKESPGDTSNATFYKHVKGMANYIAANHGNEAAALFIEHSVDNAQSATGAKILQGSDFDGGAMAATFRARAERNADVDSVRLSTLRSDTNIKLDKSPLMDELAAAVREGPDAVMGVSDVILDRIAQGADETYNSLSEGERGFVSGWVRDQQAKLWRESQAQKTQRSVRDYNTIIAAAIEDPAEADRMLSNGAHELTGQQWMDARDVIVEARNSGSNALFNAWKAEGAEGRMKDVVRDSLSTGPDDPIKPGLFEQRLEELRSRMRSRVQSLADSGTELDDAALQAEFGKFISEVQSEPKYQSKFRSVDSAFGGTSTLAEAAGTGDSLEVETRGSALATLEARGADSWSPKPQRLLGKFNPEKMERYWDKVNPIFFNNEDPVTRIHELTADMPGLQKDGKPYLVLDGRVFTQLRRNLKSAWKLEGMEAQKDLLLTKSIMRTGRVTVGTAHAGLKDAELGEILLDGEVREYHKGGDVGFHEAFKGYGEMEWDEVNPFEAKYYDYRDAWNYLEDGAALGDRKVYTSAFPKEKQDKLKQYLFDMGVTPSDTNVIKFVEQQARIWR